jgi:outer membrane protein assembly factor BamB
MLKHTLLLLIGVSTAIACHGADNWPQFRGEGSLGVGTGPTPPSTWSQTENVLWKTPIAGRGWSCPIVWGDRVFLTTVVSEGKVEVAKKGLYFGGERMKPSTDVHHWHVLCLDFNTGKVLWDREVHKGAPEGTMHIKNSFASETQVTDGERVYSYFGNVGVFCHDMNGELLWSRRLPVQKTRFGWGTASSPVLHQGKLFIQNDNEEKSYLLAINAKTSSDLWKIERDEKSNWATPFVWKNEQRTELITCGSKKVRSYDLDGKLLWEFSGMSNIAIPTPFARDGLLYVSSGYVMDKLRPLYAVRPGASGDITLKEEETSNQHIAWSQRLAGPYNPSPLLYGEHLYVLYDRGLLACLDAKTGKPVYEKQRLDQTVGAFTASPWAYDGKIFCLSEDGDTIVVQAGPVFKMIGKNSLDELCMATPAIVRGSVLIRAEGHLYRIGKK